MEFVTESKEDDLNECSSTNLVYQGSPQEDQQHCINVELEESTDLSLGDYVKVEFCFKYFLF